MRQGEESATCFCDKRSPRVPSCVEEIAACITVKINEMCCSVDGLYDHIKNHALPKPTLHGATESKTEQACLYALSLRKTSLLSWSPVVLERGLPIT